MTTTIKTRLAILIFVIVLALASVGCGTLGSACYSTFDGCAATSEAIRSSPQYNGY